MPAKTIGPQVYGRNEFPVFIAAVYRLLADESGVVSAVAMSRSEIVSIKVTHSKLMEDWSGEDAGQKYAVVNDIDGISVPLSSFLDEVVDSQAAFEHTGYKPFPYNFIFVVSGIDFFPEHGEYKTIVEIEKVDGTPPESIVFMTRCEYQHRTGHVVFGDTPRLVGKLYVKVIEDDGRVLIENETIIDHLYRTVLKDGIPVSGQFRVLIPNTAIKAELIEDQTAFQGSGTAEFSYNFEHTPTDRIFPGPGRYSVRFEAVASNETLIGTVEQEIEVRQ